MSNSIKEVIPTKNADVLGIRYFDLDSIIPLEKNFKRHDVVAIAASYRKHGILDPIGIDELTEENFDGNGRVEGLQFMRGNGEAPPRRVIEKGGKWYVPVLTGVSFDSEAARVAAAATLNRLNELGGVDEALQAEILEWLQKAEALEATGFDDSDVKLLLEKLSHSQETEQTFDHFFVENPEGKKEERIRIVLDFIPAKGELVKTELLKHGKTFEDAVCNLLKL